MIFSELKMFADKQVIALANDNADHNVELENTIDLGVSDKPYRVSRALKRNISNGDPIPIMFTMNSTNAVAAYNFYMQASSTGASGSFTTIYSTPIFRNAGGHGYIKYLPARSDRFLKMFISYKQDTASAGKQAVVTAAIGTYQPSQLSDI